MMLIENMENVKASGTTVLIRQDKRDDGFKTESGVTILKAEAYKFKPKYGTVMSVGNDVPAWYGVAAGQRVLFNAWAGMDVYLNDDEYKFIRYKDVMAVVEE